MAPGERTVVTSAGAAATSSEPPANLGTRLRQARLETRMTVRELARQLGVSASFISQLENGKSQPSVATLYSLGQVLRVPLQRLFEEPDGEEPDNEPLVRAGLGDAAAGGAGVESLRPADEAVPEDPVSMRRALGSISDAWGDSVPASARLSVTKPGHRTRLEMDCGVTWDQLVRKTDHLDFMEITYPPGSSSTTDGRMLRHDDYEYGYLLEGQLEVTVGFDVFTLRAGEAIGFDSSTPHLFTNPGSTPARGIWVVHHRVA